MHAIYMYACCGMPVLTYAHARPKLLEELKKSEEAVTQKLSVEEGKHRVLVGSACNIF